MKGQGVDIGVELYDTNDLAVLDLANGRVDAYVGNVIPMREFIKRQPIRMPGIIYDLRPSLPIWSRRAIRRAFFRV